MPGFASVGGASVGSKLKSLIPPLTADSQKGYTVSYTPKGDNPAWYAFSGDLPTSGTPDKYVMSGTNKKLTFYVEFPRAVTVDLIAVVYASIGNSGTAYSFQSLSYQNDTETWTSIPLVSTNPDMVIPKKRPTEPHKSYRIVLDYLGGYGIAVSQILFFGK